MKKLFCFVAIALLVAGLSTSAFAASASTDLHDTKYTIVNNSATATATTIASGIIGGGSQYELLSVEVTQYLAGHTGTTGEALVAVYDSALPITSIGAFVECELESNDDTSVSKEWVRPLKIYNGVTIMQGAYSVVTIEYQKRW